jgi:hypothetical protein
MELAQLSCPVVSVGISGYKTKFLHPYFLINITDFHYVAVSSLII